MYKDWGSRIHMERCLISGNATIYDGGGIASHTDGDLTLSNCILSGNLCTGVDSGRGGAIYCSLATVSPESLHARGQFGDLRRRPGLCVGRTSPEEQHRRDPQLHPVGPRRQPVDQRRLRRWRSSTATCREAGPARAIATWTRDSWTRGAGMRRGPPKSRPTTSGSTATTAWRGIRRAWMPAIRRRSPDAATQRFRRSAPSLGRGGGHGGVRAEERASHRRRRSQRGGILGQRRLRAASRWTRAGRSIPRVSL